MAKRNGYFRLNIEPDSVSLQLVPPTDGGAGVTIAEIMEYLKTVKIYDYDPHIINKVLSTLKEPTVFKISEESISAVPEIAKIRISDDRMAAVIRLYPPSNQGKLFNKSDLLGELTLAGIKYGIIDKAVDTLVATPVFGHDIIIARGKEVRQGRDAVIQYNFDTKPLAKPKMNEDGTVDFHQLNLFTRVEKDQLLATLIPEDAGEPGIDVYNKPIPPRKVRKAVLKGDRNTRLTEDHLQMYSEVSGDVKLEGDTVFVSNSYVVPADVDASTGDIIYDGNVIVNGNVRTGFMIQSKGDVQIKGVVEGAEIFADGNIILARGIQGMNRGLLEAKGDIITKFIESAKVKSGGTVRSGSVLHSTVEAGDKILCEGRKSYVVGGTLIAGNLIDVKTIGNDMGTITNVMLGVDASVSKNLSVMLKEAEMNKEQLEKCIQVLLLFKKKVAAGQKLTPDKIEIVKSASVEKTRLEERQTELTAKIIETKQLIEANTKGRLKVSDVIHSGVNITISNCQYTVKDDKKYCQFLIRDGEIISEGL